MSVNFKAYLDEAEAEPKVKKVEEEVVEIEEEVIEEEIQVFERNYVSDSSLIHPIAQDRFGATVNPNEPESKPEETKSVASQIMKEDVPLKTDKRLLEALKTANSQNKRLIESINKNNKMFLEAIATLNATNVSLLETNVQIVSKLEELQAIEIPAPIVQIQPARITERKIIRDPKTKLMQGFIDVPADEDEE